MGVKTEIDSENVCKTCGAIIPAGAPGGLCPACILVGSQQAAGVVGAPPLEQIAAAFPELEVLGLVGRGGMGAVYHARQPKLDRDLALKVLLPDLGADPAFEERFSREARALAKLNHPNIVGVYDFGERDGLFYLTMEFVDGVNLRQAMEAGRFTPEQAVAVIPGICDALQEAHGRGILHRDIKPENILLDRDGRVKIVDFGIARMIGDGAHDFTLTQSGAVIGSRQYMAPEQLEGSSSIDQRADIYSLGVVFYEMLTGELPIGRFRPPSEKSATTKYIDEVVMRSLEKELERRFQTVGEVKTQVETAASMRAGVAARPAAKERKSTPGEVAGVAKMTLWVTGLILLAPVLAGMALAVRAPGREAWVIVLFWAGVVSALVGYVGSWLALHAMQRSEISLAGRTWLRLIAIALPVVGVAALASIWASHEFRDFGKGSVFLTMIAAAVPTYLIASALAKAAGLAVVSWSARQWAWRGIALLMVATGIFAGSRDGHWPLDHSKLRGLIKLPSLGEHELGPAIEKAAGERLGDYQIRSTGDQVAITVLHETRSASVGRAPFEQLVKDWSRRVEPGNQGESVGDHVRAFKQRLLDALPAEAIVNAKLQYLFMRGSAKDELICFGLLAALAAAAMGVMGFPSGLCGICAMVFAYGVMLFVPARAYPADGPQLVRGPALGELEPEPIVADFSTPAAAARTYVEAMSRVDLGLIERAVAAEEFERMTKYFDPLQPGIRAEVSGFEGGRVLAVEPSRNRSGGERANPGVSMTVRMVSRDGSRLPEFQGWFSESPDGTWKLATKP